MVMLLTRSSIDPRAIPARNIVVTVLRCGEDQEAKRSSGLSDA